MALALAERLLPGYTESVPEVRHEPGIRPLLRLPPQLYRHPGGGHGGGFAAQSAHLLQSAGAAGVLLL